VRDGAAETGSFAMTADQDILSRAFDATSYAMMMTAADGTILQVNPAFTRVTGWSPEEAVGRTPSLISSGRQDIDFYEDMWRSMTEAGRWQGEIWNRRKDGEAYLSSPSSASACCASSASRTSPITTT
jgi:PAS domain S-box-containing protein